MNATSTVHHFDTGPFNWYLVEQDSRLTLVDAGFPGHYATLVKGLQSIGRELKDIEAILITHAHADHTGFAEKLSLVTGAPVFVHEADRDALTRILQLPWWGLLSNGWRPSVGGMLAHAIVNGVFAMTRVSRPRTFRQGDVLEVPGRPRVIHTPGHTVGEVSFHFPEAGALLCGDTLATRDVMSGRAGLPQIMRPILTHHFAQAQKSLAELRGLETLKLYPGHGAAWQGNMAEAVEVALAACHGR